MQPRVKVIPSHTVGCLAVGAWKCGIRKYRQARSTPFTYGAHSTAVALPSCLLDPTFSH